MISILMAEDDPRCFHELEQFISDYGRETGQTIHITRYEIGEDLVEHYKPEFDLLLLLMENKGKVLHKEYIFNQVWGLDSCSEPQTLTVHIKWLRQKIEENPKSPKRLLTVWGVGYQFL